MTSRVQLKSLFKDQKVQHFTEDSQDSPAELERKAQLYTAYYFRDFVVSAFDNEALLDHLKSFVESFEGEGKNSKKSEFQNEALEWYKMLEEIRPAMLKFQQQIHRIIDEDEKALQYAVERVQAACAYFEPIVDGLVTRINDHIAALILKKGTKGYLKTVKLELDQVKQMKSKFQKAVLLGQTMLTGKLLTKADLPVSRVEESQEDEDVRSLKLKGKEAKKNLDSKTDTKRMTLVLYHSGMSPKEIAAKRELTLQTIENHLLYFVKSGEVQVQDFVSEERKKTILLKVEQIGSNKLSEVKEALPQDYTYSEIRFALSE